MARTLERELAVSVKLFGTFGPNLLLVLTLGAVAFALAHMPACATPPPKADSKPATKRVSTKPVSTKPFAIVYSIAQGPAHYKQYVWSDGKGALRLENEMPYAKIDGITDVIFQDFNTGKQFVVNTMFKTVEVGNLNPMSMPIEDSAFKAMKAKSLGTKSIAGFNCTGWGYKAPNGQSKEVWISPDLKWFLEHKSSDGSFVITAVKASGEPPPLTTFDMPSSRKYRYLDVSREPNPHQHQHPHGHGH